MCLWLRHCSLDTRRSRPRWPTGRQDTGVQGLWGSGPHSHQPQGWGGVKPQCREPGLWLGTQGRGPGQREGPGPLDPPGAGQAHGPGPACPSSAFGNHSSSPGTGPESRPQVPSESFVGPTNGRWRRCLSRRRTAGERRLCQARAQSDSARQAGQREGGREEDWTGESQLERGRGREPARRGGRGWQRGRLKQGESGPSQSKGQR